MSTPVTVDRKSIEVVVRLRKVRKPEGYPRAIRRGLHILDRFHIVAQMNKALNQVHAGEARRMASGGLSPVLKKFR